MEKKDIKKMTIEEAEKFLKDYEEVNVLFNKKQNLQHEDDCPFKVGKNYFIRTVTHHYTGLLIKVGSSELIMKDVAWIADDGRFTKALESEEFDEVEVYPKGVEVIIGRGAILDAVIISKLPSKQK